MTSGINCRKSIAHQARINNANTTLEELIEAKFSDENISKSFLYYAKRLNPKRATQIVATIKRPYDKNQIKVTDPVSYFQKFF